jgi:hypothetical protein
MSGRTTGWVFADWLIAAGGPELALVARFPAVPTVVECHVAFIDCRDDEVAWRQPVARTSAHGGEVWLFDAEPVWPDHDRRVRGDEPPDTWMAHHGLYLVDGYAPDDQGRVVCGGPY